MSIIFLVLVLFLGIFVWTFTSINSIIIGGGSTSVNDVMVDTTDAYHHQTGQDVLYNSLGSAAAVVGVKNNSYQFGFLSQDIPDINGKNNVDAVNLWNNNGIIRFAIAQDYIMLVYHLPNGCSFNSGVKQLTFQLDDSDNNTIKEIYLQHKTWKDVFPDQVTCSHDSPFFTLTREAGSGTRQFFEKTIIDTTNYTTNQVATSNGDMFQAIENTPNSIGYLSFSFLQQIKDSGLSLSAIGQVKKIPDGQSYLPYDPETFSFNSEYPEVRPFTGIMGKIKVNPAIDFIAWLLDPVPFYLYEEQKYYPNIIAYTDSQIWKNSAAYWYIHNGARPVSVTSVYHYPNNKNINDYNNLYNVVANSLYNYFNNNNQYLQHVSGNKMSKYQSIFELIYNRLKNKYQSDNNSIISKIGKELINYLKENQYPIPDEHQLRSKH